MESGFYKIKKLQDNIIDYDQYNWNEVSNKKWISKPYMHGWFGSGNKRVLSNYLNDQPLNIIELGSWYGKSTNYILNSAPNANLYCVDLWNMSDILKGTQSIKSTHQVNYFGEKKNIGDLFKIHPLRDTFFGNVSENFHRLTAIQGNTIDGLKLIKSLIDKPIDLIYIDADHKYKPVVDEIELCLEYFPEAQLIGDDFTAHKSVKKAVEFICEKYNFRYGNDCNCWYLLK